MPTYEYLCPACDHTFEETAVAYDTDKLPCPKCHQIARRVPVYREQGVIFSGSGFTRSVVPPARPLPRSTRGENTEVDFEIKSEYAEEVYKHDKNVRPYQTGRE